MDGDVKDVSTRPYLLRALHEWCADSGLTPYIVVRVDDSVQVPREYVTDGEIVLNVSDEATSALQISNEFVVFKARFGGKPRDIAVPIGRVSAIYARENGQGMAFPVEDGPAATEQAPGVASHAAGLQSVKDTKAPAKPQGDPSKPTDPHGRRPTLTRIK